MKQLSADEYEALSKDARVLEQDAYGPKVLLTPDGTILKLFRRKRLLSLAGLYPYALRFRRNARLLERYGIPSVKVESVYRCPAIERDLVSYHLLPGQPLRDALGSDPAGVELLEGLARFIALLHHKSIYFRSLHLGNVLVRPTGGFALIDVADLRFRWLPMGPLSRVRNFRHLFRYDQDMVHFRRFGLKRFLSVYLLASGLSPWAARMVLGRLFRRRHAANG